jgi:Na+-transporting NADH:ubiquinone oxidoreductase subunit NqrC
VVAIKAIQEQQALIDHQKETLETLRLEQSQQTKKFEMQIERNAALEARLAKLEQEIQHNTELEDRLAKLEALLLEDRQVAGAPQH